jgi:hypothetical protein
MTTSVHPAYDPLDKVWFTEDGVTAKSLALLQKKLSGIKIEGYYPNSYGNVVHPRPPQVVKIKLTEALKMRTPPLVEPVKQPEPTKEKVKPTGATVESEKVVEYQQPQQPRPRQKRQPSEFPPVDWQLLPNQERLKQLVDEGLSSKQIGDLWPVSRNAIIGACARLGYELKRSRGSYTKPKSSWGSQFL